MPDDYLVFKIDAHRPRRQNFGCVVSSRHGAKPKPPRRIPRIRFPAWANPDWADARHPRTDPPYPAA